MTRVLVLLGVVTLAGCGGGDPDPAAILSQTSENLGKIKSAESMHLKLSVEPAEGDPFEFELEGPVALCRQRALPLLDVEYTKIANGEDETVRILANGTQGFVVLDGTAYQMSERQAANLSSACQDLESGDGGLASLSIGDWVRDPEASSGDDVDTVTGELNVIAAVTDLVGIARAFGDSTLARLGRADAQRIADATEDSSFELETGHDDHLLRRLAAVGGTFTFELELEDPNGQVEIQSPESALPASEQPKG